MTRGEKNMTKGRKTNEKWGKVAHHGTERYFTMEALTGAWGFCMFLSTKEELD